MEMWMWIVIAVVAAVVIVGALAIWYSARRRRQRSERLQSKFGQEYDAAVAHADRKHAEEELEARQKRVESFDLRELHPAEAARFADLWRGTQERFVDDPGGAVADADRLVGELMGARGYPMADFEQRAADVSVDHPDVVSNYRTAHRIAAQHSRGQASTEQLRQAMVHYRALFTGLLETREPAAPESVSEDTPVQN
jgi:hypothetical protein